MSAEAKSLPEPISPSEETEDLDLTALLTRGVDRIFDGNLTSRTRLWHWVYASRLEPEDWEMMGRSRRLDWVVIPLSE